MFAQLRDVLAAKDSSVMPEKNQHRGLTGPQRAETNHLPITIRKGDLRKFAAERSVHGASILSTAVCRVKRAHFRGWFSETHHLS